VNSAGNNQPGYPSDEELVKRILDGERHLYEKIMRKYNPRMYRICMSIINDGIEAEEIMQVAYIKAYESLKDFQFRSSFSTWLVRILINESLKQKQRRQRNKELDGQEYKKTSNSDSPLQIIMNKELKNILEEALAKLPEKYRLVFVMREIEEMSTSETMESLSITESNVKVRLTRAKEMLRSMLSDYYKTEELYDFHLTRCDKVVKNVMSYITINQISLS
jgi:RNA polymerase sigma factor (sigma-70 family)